MTPSEHSQMAGTLLRTSTWWSNLDGDVRRAVAPTDPLLSSYLNILSRHLDHRVRTHPFAKVDRLDVDARIARQHEQKHQREPRSLQGRRPRAARPRRGA